MAYFQGSAVQNTTPTAFLGTQLQNTITSHSNWSFVETVTGVGGGTYTQDVYKCSGTGNAAGIDFYIAFIRLTAGTGASYFGVAEGYNSSTHKPKRPAMRHSTSAITTQADCGIVSSTAECDWQNGTINPGVSLTVGTPNVTSSMAATCDFFITVSNSAIIVGGSTDFYVSAGSVGNLSYVGLYDSIIPNATINDPMPLCVAGHDPTFFSSTGRMLALGTRQPMCPSASIQYAGGLRGVGDANTEVFSSASRLTTLNFTTIGSVSTADQADLLNSGQGYADKMMIETSSISGSATAGRDKNGWARGTFKHIRYSASTLLTMFDECQIDGATYIYTGFNNLFVEKNPA